MKPILICLMFCTNVAQAQELLPDDIVINEMLFNPEKNGFDYVECFNKSTKEIQLNTLLIGNGSTVRSVTKDSLIISAKSLFIITSDRQWLTTRYNIPANVVICPVASLPSFPDDEGTIVLYRKADTIEIDKVAYSAKWHFEMIQQREGVALERISPDYPSQDKNNWTSASQSSGFGTPGLTNSQFRSEAITAGEVSVLPAVFSPDNDGQADFAQVSISSPAPGSVANAIVYNAAGRQVRYLIKNALLGINNRFTWDGYDDRAKKLPTGIYIIAIQVFDTRGNVRRSKKCVVVSNLKT